MRTFRISHGHILIFVSAYNRRHAEAQCFALRRDIQRSLRIKDQVEITSNRWALGDAARQAVMGEIK